MFGLFGKNSSVYDCGPRYYDIEEVNNYKNFEVVAALRKYHNIDLGSVRVLNNLLSEMGIIEKKYDCWYLTEYGREYNVSSFHPDLWHKNIVDAIAAYLRLQN